MSLKRFLGGINLPQLILNQHEVSYEKNFIRLSLGLMMFSLSQDASAKATKLRPRATISGHSVAHRLEDREPNRPYSDRELENKASERNSHIVWAGAFGLAAGGAVVVRERGLGASFALDSLQEGSQAYEAHCDLREMERHNDRISQNEGRN
jgi:hypothetical protein